MVPPKGLVDVTAIHGKKAKRDRVFDSFRKKAESGEGASIKYVCTERGGVQKSANFADKQYWNSGRRERGGVKNPENPADVLNGSPLREETTLLRPCPVGTSTYHIHNKP